jgi:ABC-type polysaccharide/polyol phosphate export permease
MREQSVRGPSNLARALQDVRDGLLMIHVWPMLGWQEIRQRYRRSRLGPFWLTISTAVLIAGMGPLYGRLLGQDIGGYFGYLAASFVTWLFFANLLNEACVTFIAAEGYIKLVKLPLSVHVLRTVWRNLIIYAHYLPILLAVYPFVPPESPACLLLVPLGILFVAVTAVWLGLFLGMLCARFRDIPPIVGSVVQVLFFLTPVLWQASMLGSQQWVAQINPLFHFLEIIREPLLGRPPALLSWAVAAVTTILGWTATLALFAKFRARIAYWV